MTKNDFDNLTYNQKCDLVRHGNKICWNTFFVGILKQIYRIFSIESIMWLTFTVMTFLRYANGIETISFFICYTVVTCICLFKNEIGNLIKNATLAIEAKFGINKSL